MKAVIRFNEFHAAGLVLGQGVVVEWKPDFVLVMEDASPLQYIVRGDFYLIQSKEVPQQRSWIP